MPEQQKKVVGAAGIEPATAGLEIRCSIRLSYAPSITYKRSAFPGGRFGGSWEGPYEKTNTKLPPTVAHLAAARRIGHQLLYRNGDRFTPADLVSTLSGRGAT